MPHGRACGGYTDDMTEPTAQPPVWSVVMARTAAGDRIGDLPVNVSPERSRSRTVAATPSAGWASSRQ
ncbi:hypothetical protein [Allorhizocola rhizosphaerae]|uniref:hypothetical protein n=1 Tax=Allorhizocola rhizosphaerae TaxID=1872709 RepID=UPI001FEB3255|nr:hypothetical protein [Allorhizocola rhizosphaerae]